MAERLERRFRYSLIHFRAAMGHFGGMPFRSRASSNAPPVILTTPDLNHALLSNPHLGCYA